MNHPSRGGEVKVDLCFTANYANFRRLISAVLCQLSNGLSSKKGINKNPPRPSNTPPEEGKERGGCCLMLWHFAGNDRNGIVSSVQECMPATLFF